MDHKKCLGERHIAEPRGFFNRKIKYFSEELKFLKLEGISQKFIKKF